MFRAILFTLLALAPLAIGLTVVNLGNQDWRTASREPVGLAPELRAELPPTAIGKDYLGGRLVAAAPSGTGVQFSLGGLAGILVAIEEGLEINLLGATFGIDPLDLSLKAPFVGRIGTLVSGLLLAAAVGIWVFAFRR